MSRKSEAHRQIEPSRTQPESNRARPSLVSCLTQLIDACGRCELSSPSSRPLAVCCAAKRSSGFKPTARPALQRVAPPHRATVAVAAAGSMSKASRLPSGSGRHVSISLPSCLRAPPSPLLITAPHPTSSPTQLSAWRCATGRITLPAQQARIQRMQPALRPRPECAIPAEGGHTTPAIPGVRR